MIAEKRKLVKCKEIANPGESINASEASLCGEEEWIAREINLKIIIDGKEFIRFACSPVDCKDLVIGFLFTEGIISLLEEINFLIYNESAESVELSLNNNSKFDNKNLQSERTVSSGCGQGIISRLEYRRQNLIPLDFKVNASPKSFSQIFHHLKTHSEWYEKTGCMHSVILFNNDDTIIVREDIGRHNGVDKVIGAGLQCNINFENTILNCSGRLSSEMILKAVHARIPIVASRAAPTTLAVDIAKEKNITLIGFVRGSRMNVYSHPERISFTKEFNELEISELAQHN
jgi:FdhD protein